MRLQSYNQTFIDCEEVIKTLSGDRLLVVQSGIWVTLPCCTNCKKLSPDNFGRHEHWALGVNKDYYRQTRIVRTDPSGARQYPFPMEVVVCCNHIHLVRNLEDQDWDFLKANLHDPYYKSSVNKKVHKTASRQVSLSSCEFCSDPIPKDSVKCPVCFP